MYDITGFYAAKSVADAVRALHENPDAVLIAGGTDVLIQVREGRLAGRPLVSIHELPELTGISLEGDGTLRIGPCTVFSDITAHPLIREHAQMLGEAVDEVGSPQIRHMGTIGGNIANAATSADSAPSLFAYNAELELTGTDGVRRLPIAEFYTGPGKSVRRHDEVLTAIRIKPADYANFFGCYIKYGKRNAMEISTLGCAALVRLADGKIDELRLAFGVAAPTPIRCAGAEALAAGQTPDEALYAALAEQVRREITPRSSWRASAEFRLQIAGEITRRAVREAVRRAKEG
ncbi:MAG: xanthine dehydrogenase FAD-binding subunit XdhB [Oscillospiraceae bacterium]|nr:xanthine dehydrogenase FAD-binding subunit XdhB [Oscillospiraceae bacterium]